MMIQPQHENHDIWSRRRPGCYNIGALHFELDHWTGISSLSKEMKMNVSREKGTGHAWFFPTDAVVVQ